MSRTVRRNKNRKVRLNIFRQYHDYDAPAWRYYTDNGIVDFGYEDNYAYPIPNTEGEMRAEYKQHMYKVKYNLEHYVPYYKKTGAWEYY
jgi:hypothetical protein